MSEPSFSHAKDGSFTISSGLTVMRVADADVIQLFPNFNLTVSGATGSRFGRGRYSYAVNARGWLFESDAFPKASMGTPVANSIIARHSEAVMVRDAQLDDVSGDNDADGTRRFDVNGHPIWHGSARGWLLDTETPLDAADNILTAMALPVGGTNLTGNAVLDTIQANYRYRQGGAVPASWRFKMDGLPSPLPAVLSAASMACALNLDNGQTMTGTVALRRVQVSLNFRDGARIPVFITGPFTGDVDFDGGSSA